MPSGKQETLSRWRLVVKSLAKHNQQKQSFLKTSFRGEIYRQKEVFSISHQVSLPRGRLFMANKDNKLKKRGAGCWLQAHQGALCHSFLVLQKDSFRLVALPNFERQSQAIYCDCVDSSQSLQNLDNICMRRYNERKSIRIIGKQDE